MGQGENWPKAQKIGKKKTKKTSKIWDLDPLVRSSRGSRWSIVVLVRRRGGVDLVVDLLAYEVDAEGNESDAEAIAAIEAQLKMLKQNESRNDVGEVTNLERLCDTEALRESEEWDLGGWEAMGC
ncbi:hypothetical protein FH972_008535 [Carpinus fangiana]|uniref:Uncharacterized protein n=1 Tax=Carpinus fangiana TaxID=176857 RepID=A0A5N6R0N6_9ROSI|nr:hypothetical protein FH972_008535 [Carpinus fangiana]